MPLEFSTLADELADSMADRCFVASILGAFAAVGLLLALVGIGGVVSYTVAQRRREIGIRLALGAASARVRSEMRAQVLRPTVIGLAVGFGGGLLASRFVRSLLYEGVTAHDPRTMVGVAMLFVVAAAVASDVPARKATRVDPAGVLREE